MWFVPTKTPEQQSVLMLHRTIVSLAFGHHRSLPAKVRPLGIVSAAEEHADHDRF